MRFLSPGQFEFRANQHEREQAPVWRLRPDALQQLECRGVDPVHVLEHEQDRARLRLGLEQLENSRKGSVFLLLRCELGRRVQALGGNRQQHGQQHHDLVVLAAPLFDKHRETFEFLRRSGIERYAGRALEQMNDRIPGTARVIGRALKRDQLIVFVGQALLQRDSEPRFSNSGIAGNDGHAATATFCPQILLVQQLQFCVAADQGSEMRGLACFKTAGDSRRSDHPPHSNLLLEPLDAVLAEVGEIKQPAQQPPGGGRHQQLVRTRQRL